jgi:hypothetical protein
MDFRFYNSDGVNTHQNPSKYVKTPLEKLYFFEIYNPNRVRERIVEKEILLKLIKNNNC